MSTTAHAQAAAENCSGFMPAINGGSCCPYDSGANALPTGADNVDFSSGFGSCTNGGGGAPTNGDDGAYLLQLQDSHSLSCTVTFNGVGGGVAVTDLVGCVTPLTDCHFGEEGATVTFDSSDLPSGGQYVIWIDATAGQTVDLDCTGTVPVELEGFSVD